jgi:branched-chain amino acid transport system ATP-binding protein
MNVITSPRHATTTTASPLLAVEGLTRRFGGVAAVDEVSFAIAPGKIHALIGPNGAGKTTLFNLVAGVLPPSAGRVTLAGRDVTALSPTARARAGLQRTFQNLQIFSELSAIENVMVGAHLRTGHDFLACLLGLPAIRRANTASVDKAEALMRRVGLAAQLGARAAALSYGMLKRLEIARALAAEPRLLLLDEPAAGLNHAETNEIDTLIRSVVADGVTVLLVEHDMKLVMSLSDHIVVLDHGRKIAEGPPDSVRANPAVIQAYLGTGGARRRRPMMLPT